MRMYAIYAGDIGKAEYNEETPIFKSADKTEIVKESDKIKGPHYIEIYEETEGGEFYKGSDFDTPENFKKNIDKR